MTPEQLRTVIGLLERRVGCAPSPAGGCTVSFAPPTAADLAAAGIAVDEAERVLTAPWWPEMVDEIVDTPTFCGDDEPPETVLRYARDVVGEYVRKRFTP